MAPEHLDTQWAEQDAMSDVNVCLTHGTFPPRDGECSGTMTPYNQRRRLGPHRVRDEHRDKYPPEWFDDE